MSFVAHLECSLTGARLEHDRFHGVSEANAPLLVRYDLKALAAAVTKEDLAARPPGMWRYSEFLPNHGLGETVSLGEPETPLIPAKTFAGGNVLVKDEGRMPTGSFKARGLAVAVTMAKASR